MKVVKIVNEHICSITQDELSKLLDKFEDGECFTCEEKRCFLVERRSPTLKEATIVIDNRDGLLKQYIFTLTEALAYILDIQGLAQEIS